MYFPKSPEGTLDNYDEFNTDNHGALLEMSYVLIEVFGLTDKQVQEIERNDGLTNADLKK